VELLRMVRPLRGRDGVCDYIFYKHGTPTGRYYANIKYYRANSVVAGFWFYPATRDSGAGFGPTSGAMRMRSGKGRDRR